MADKALLDWVEGSRRKTVFHAEDGQYRIESRQDVTDIVKAAGALADKAPGKDFRLVALIPEAVLNQALVEGWANDQDQWKKWANDPANRDYRVWKGRM